MVSPVFLAMLAAVAALAVHGRAEAQPPPVQLSASSIIDLLANARGGVDRGVGYLSRSDLRIETRPGLIGIEGATAFVDLVALHGDAFSAERVGDALTVSNIEADPALRLLEAWIQVPLGATSRVKAGMIDLNGEYDVQSVGALFLNSAHGIGPEFSQSGLDGPSIFPLPSIGIVGEWQVRSWEMRIGLFDSPGSGGRGFRRRGFRAPAGEGVLIAAEAQWRMSPGVEVQAGAWAHSGRFDLQGTSPGQGPLRRRASRGSYIMVEARLAGGGERPATSGWIRVGIADGRVNAITGYLGGGLVYGTDAWQLGIALAHARLGDQARGQIPERRARAETAIELTYARRLADWLTVQPDLQYVIDPGWDRSVGDALIVGLRLTASWTPD